MWVGLEVEVGGGGVGRGGWGSERWGRGLKALRGPGATPPTGMAPHCERWEASGLRGVALVLPPPRVRVPAPCAHRAVAEWERGRRRGEPWDPGAQPTLQRSWGVRLPSGSGAGGGPSAPEAVPVLGVLVGRWAGSSCKCRWVP